MATMPLGLGGTRYMQPSGRRVSPTSPSSTYLYQPPSPSSQSEHMPLNPKGAHDEDLLGDIMNYGMGEYVYVGPDRGSYEQSMRGNYHYVGPNKGHFDLAPGAAALGAAAALGRGLAPGAMVAPAGMSVTTKIIIGLVTLGGTGITTGCVIKAVQPKQEMFDCAANFADWQTGWSDMKKAYCCENTGRGCVEAAVVDDPSIPTLPVGGIPAAAQPPPKWLDAWMGDLSIGSKFVLTTAIVFCIGWALGAVGLYKAWPYLVPPTRSKTEAELLMEMTKLLKRCGAATSGELTVTLMWDTIDDLDLHLKLPNGGEICAETPYVKGGRLDLGADRTRGQDATKPLENIFWPEWDHRPGCVTNPPEGTYTVTVRVWEKEDHYKDANITVVVSIRGVRTVHHYRIVPGMTELKVCEFPYSKPVA